MDSLVSDIVNDVCTVTKKLGILTTEICEQRKSVSNLNNEIHAQTKQLGDMQKNIDGLMLQIESMQGELHEKRALDAKLACANTRILELERENGRIIEENKSFMKVSQIVAYEKENAKLRKEIEALNEKLNNVYVDKPVIEPKVEAPSVDETEVEKKKVEEAEEEPELSLYEKKIKGVVYYVSDDVHMRIYTRLPDGEVGDEVGKYEKDEETGKSKAVFFT